MNENNTKNAIILISATIAVSGAAAICYYALKNKSKSDTRKESGRSIKSEANKLKQVFGNGQEFLYIPVSNEVLGTIDEQENDRLTQYIGQNFTHRFNPAQWTCAICSKVIGRADSFYRCADCDLFVSCKTCYETNDNLPAIHLELQKKTNEMVNHNDEYVFKIEFQRSFSPFPSPCAVQIEDKFTYFANRYFIGEKRIEEEKSKKKISGKGRIIGDFEWYTYAEVYDEVINLGAALYPLDITRESIISICSENRLEWAIADFCCMRHGFTSAAMNNSLSVEEYSSIFKSLPFKAIICSGKLVPKIVEALRVLQEQNSEFEAPVIISMDTLPEIELVNEYGFRIFTYSYLTTIGQKLNASSATHKPDAFRVRDDITQAITFTSGSTGCPKGVLFKESRWRETLSHAFSFRNVVLYGYLPFDHSAGRSDLYSAFYNGGRIALPHPSHSHSSFFTDVQQIRPTAFGLIPLICNIVHQHFQATLQNKMLEFPDQPKESLEEQLKKSPNFRNIFGNRISSIKISSAPVSIEMIRFLRDILQVRISSGYGSTEVGSITLNSKLTQPVRLVSVPELGYFISNSPPQGSSSFFFSL